MDIEDTNDKTRNTSLFETGRASWWKSNHRKTPCPGDYETHDWLYELEAKPTKMTYGFKSSGRKTRADKTLRGEVLMPGLYNNKDSFIDLQENKKSSYGFKNTNRENKSAVYIGIQDKEMLKSDLGPTKYAKDFEFDKRNPSTYASFKSQSARFPTIHFKPKTGPPPTQYEVKEKRTVSISSPFKSGTPRFKRVHVMKTPGPGAYAKMVQYPMPKHIHDVGRYHGIFFPPSTTTIK
ncbi:protein STPG4-like [Clytia hemisphaerica]|uniref:protein STPG4-like n=1 Tax=Clytia hemisphaerica TaxID=252671 RepID=UPI0034D71B51